MSASAPSAGLQLAEAPAVKTGILIRRAPAEVFRAVVDPAITTKVWYTKSSGPMTRGAHLTWEWEMYGVSTDVVVEEVEEDNRVRFTWSGYTPEHPTTVEFRFVPHGDRGTYTEITETGFTGTGDQLVRNVADSTGGFAFVLCGLKALLEHDLVLGIVADVNPADLQQQ